MVCASKVAKIVDAILQENVRSDRPGVAVLIVAEGEVLYKKGYGRAKFGGEAITPASMFDLASVSKHITATAIALLAERGQLDFDDPVSKHIPALGRTTKGRPILIQDLLWHTSGLTDYTSDQWNDDGDDSTVTNEEFIVWLVDKDLESAPGTEFVYNNTGYAVLARVVEVLSGQSYSAFAEANLFKPLGMTRTVAWARPRQTLTGVVTGYKTQGNSVIPSDVPSIIQGDGNVFTCLDDLVLWDLAMRSGTLLSKASLKRAWTPGTLDDGRSVEDEAGSGYGFGWFTSIEESSVFHSGAWAGTATSYSRYWKDDVSLVILSNNESIEVANLSSAIEEALENT
jgi:CubicO group peptidase (beta-lactamase class C family)